jgi:hypothetical protein
MKASETPDKNRSQESPFPTVPAAQEAPSRETDLYAWLLYQAIQLRSRKPDFIDWSELAEELDEIVALAKSEVVSRCSQVRSWPIS